MASDPTWPTAHSSWISPGVQRRVTRQRAQRLFRLSRPVPKVLGLDHLGLTEADLDTEFHTGSCNDAIKPRLKLREIIAQLKHIYCGSIGAEFAHVSNETERLWLQDCFQVGRVQQHYSPEARMNVLWGLTMAEGLERYLATRYPAQKRFSLEGGDSLIPLLEDLIQTSGAHGVEDIVIGMAHRGRLNVLVNVLGKVPEALFSEFEGNYDLKKLKGSGDVKYHKGYSCDVRTPGGNVHIALAFNPSHLEVVNPVVEGSVRARQERRGDAAGDKVMPVLIHGDSAFAAQGVIQETLQMSQAPGLGSNVHALEPPEVSVPPVAPDARAFEERILREQESRAAYGCNVNLTLAEVIDAYVASDEYAARPLRSDRPIGLPRPLEEALGPTGGWRASTGRSTGTRLTCSPRATEFCGFGAIELAISTQPPPFAWNTLTTCT